jgi:hypothetical protein
VEDLLAAGLSVMTAVNIQHLEGVQDVVKSATGLEIRERVPDRVIREADSIVNVDLPISELRERLREGKIYPPPQAAAALENFFREDNLRALRELALRETAENVDRDRAETSGSFPATSPIRVAVALPLDPPTARALIRRGSRLAGRMNTRWYALYVRRRRDRPSQNQRTFFPFWRSALRGSFLSRRQPGWWKWMTKSPLEPRRRSEKVGVSVMAAVAHRPEEPHFPGIVPQSKAPTASTSSSSTSTARRG